MEKHIFVCHIKNNVLSGVQTELANIQITGYTIQVTANANQTSATVESGKVRFITEQKGYKTKGMYAFIEINKQSDPNTFAWKTRVCL